MEKHNKRQMLVEAAYKVFAQKGYKNASVKDIAHYADITPGLVHYYFESKEELFFEVQKKVQREYHLRYSDAEKESASLLEVIGEIKTRASENPDWYRLRYESYALGMRGEGFREGVAAFLKEGRESIARPIMDAETGLPEDMEFAGILLACFDGLALQKMVDDDFDLDKAYEFLWGLFSSYRKKE